MKPVYLVDGKRTPQVKAGAELKEIAAPYLGHYLIRHLVDKYALPFDQIDEVIVGNTGTPAKYPNVGRVIALEAGLHKKTSGYSVHRNCASGMEALSQAYDKITSGRSHLVFAGGVESMSQMPLIYSKQMTNFFAELMKAKSTAQKLKVFSSFRPHYLAPVIAIEQGLTDPFCGRNMGQTAETLARELGISRQEQDEFANLSHHKAAQATKEGKFRDEILPITAGEKLDKMIADDMGFRANSTVEGLAKLKPAFAAQGVVTAGNSSQTSDGAAFVVVMSERLMKQLDLTPIGRLLHYAVAGVDPRFMGIGPVQAIPKVLQEAGKKLNDIDLIELNEAFASQSIAVMRELSLDPQKVNINGGAIALGHPLGCTGAKLTVQLLGDLKRRNERLGMVTACVGGGQGVAGIFECL